VRARGAERDVQHVDDVYRGLRVGRNLGASASRVRNLVIHEVACRGGVFARIGMKFWTVDRVEPIVI